MRNKTYLDTCRQFSGRDHRLGVNANQCLDKCLRVKPMEKRMKNASRLLREGQSQPLGLQIWHDILLDRLLEVNDLESQLDLWESGLEDLDCKSQFLGRDGIERMRSHDGWPADGDMKRR
jgi:hypothetical protein